VYASSETLLGLPFSAASPPPYLPVDEEYPSRPRTTYALVKHLEEEMAGKLVEWDPELSITGLRFSNVFEPADYADVPGWQADAKLRLWNTWGYIDARDGAQAVVLAVEAKRPGFDRFIIAAADTLMERPSAELAAEQLPGVEFTRPVTGNETLLSIDKARSVLGYDPKHSWRDHA
jgi:UDP-glucose 4-epimerase